MVGDGGFKAVDGGGHAVASEMDRGGELTRD
jgi:hypothetical protein